MTLHESDDEADLGEFYPQERCLRLLIENVQKQVEPLCLPCVQVVCVCIPAAADHEHDVCGVYCDFVVLQRSTLIRKVDELKRGLAHEHPFIIDVSGSVPISVDPLMATECLLKCFEAFADLRSSPMKIERVIPSDLAYLRNAVGVCLLAGWLLGYPSLYQNGQDRRELSCSSVGNALSMQPLRKYSITVPSSALLEFGSDECASKECEPCLLRFCSGDSVTVFQFTIPVALMEESHASFDTALQAQMSLVQSVFGSVELSSSVFIEPHVMM
jgi:hypothetical protein